MANLVTGGIGSSPPVVELGLGGPAIPTGSLRQIRNPSFETPGPMAGDASEWTAEATATLEEYALFNRPGSSVVTDEIPPWLPELGFSIVPYPEGGVTIIQAAGLEGGVEDFSEAWHGNEDYYFVLHESLCERAHFGMAHWEDFKWDGELINDWDLVPAAETVDFYHPPPRGWVPYESFNGEWPASAPEYFLNNVRSINFGTWNNGTGIWTPNADLTEIYGLFQYGDALRITVLEAITSTISFTISFKDGAYAAKTKTITLANKAVGYTYIENLEPSVIGIHEITPPGVVVVTPGAGKVEFLSEPYRVVNAPVTLPLTKSEADWERATFNP